MLVIPVSAKAVLIAAHRVLLARNDRAEWELPGGRPEPGETLEEAVAREVAEETGLRVRVGLRVHVETFAPVPGTVVRIVAFRCTVAESAATLRPSPEHDLIAFVPLGELGGLALPDVYRRAIAATNR